MFLWEKLYLLILNFHIKYGIGTRHENIYIINY